MPGGSGNDLARHLGIPRGDVAAALAVIARGAVRRVDLGRAETADGTTAWFTTVANTGFDAEANRWANTLDWVTGTPLYVLAVLRTLTTYRPRPVRITVDGDATDIDGVAGRGGQHAQLRERHGDHTGGVDARRPARRVRGRARVAPGVPPHVPLGVPRHPRAAPES